jgi:hypothetical protein
VTITKWQMQALASDGALKSWLSIAPDWQGVGFPGPGAPIDVVLAAGGITMPGDDSGAHQVTAAGVPVTAGGVSVTVTIVSNLVTAGGAQVTVGCDQVTA